MKVISVPARFRVATGLLLLCVPLAAVETIIVSRAPWWKLPHQSIEAYSLATALLIAPLAAWMAHGKKWALNLTAVLAVFWCILSVWLSVQRRNTSLGFFTILLMIFWSGLWFWLRHEMGRSFFDPELSWFQGLPKAIPGLECHIIKGGSNEGLRVSRLDRNGAFLFSTSNPLGPVSAGQKAELAFSFRDRQVRCWGLPIRVLERNMGAGFQFSGMSSDSQKELGDFVETLRGEGYVS